MLLLTISEEPSVRNVIINTRSRKLRHQIFFNFYKFSGSSGFRGKKIYMANKKYWQNFSEFNESEQQEKLSADEFQGRSSIISPNAGREETLIIPALQEEIF